MLTVVDELGPDRVPGILEILLHLLLPQGVELETRKDLTARTCLSLPVVECACANFLLKK